MAHGSCSYTSTIEGDIVNAGGQMRHKIRELHPGFTMPGKCAHARQERRFAVGKLADRACRSSREAACPGAFAVLRLDQRLMGLGPPTMNIRMTDLAVPGKCIALPWICRARVGLTTHQQRSRPWQADARANAPKPPRASTRKLPAWSVPAMARQIGKIHNPILSSLRNPVQHAIGI